MKSILVLFMTVCFASSAQAANQPNVVLVFIDDMGWGDFSCFGSPGLALWLPGL